MSRSFAAALAATLLLVSPARTEPAKGNSSMVIVVGCWPGVTWDEFAIRDELPNTEK